jgi:predicted nucleotidyltransferase
MAKKRFDPEEAARDAVAAARSSIGDGLESATLYGSAAMGAFDADRSDVNIAFILRELDPATLGALRSSRPVWTRRRVVRPLLLTRAVLESSRDTFPLEYLLIRTFHQPLEGADPFASLVIERPALRLQVERTLRTQSLALAWSYLDAAETPEAARQWATRAGTAIAASVSGLLHLIGETIPPARSELVARAAARFGAPEAALRDVLLPPTGRSRVETTTLFAEARECLQRLLDAVERLDATPESVAK